ncbi:GapA-binding peptide SR1P [Paenibacillus sp. EPM92]|uniref:GapA-binding peptide SR1P n=1 Tax=Paenibacillus sp. EPM92 TaxID=1561195 RepID=UPI0022AA5180|nr:GapA-binding peptide SR1P [Paenibacillus sp. EPM92]
MENSSISVDLGVILCKHCAEIIGTFDSEKVTTYYSDCQEPDCLETRKNTNNQQ